MQVSAADVAAVVAAWTRIPMEALAAADAVRLQLLPEALAVSHTHLLLGGLIWKPMCRAVAVAETDKP